MVSVLDNGFTVQSITGSEQKYGRLFINLIDVMLDKSFVRPEPLVERFTFGTVSSEDFIDLRNNAHHFKLSRMWVFGQDRRTENVQFAGLVFRNGNTSATDPTDGIAGLIGELSED